MAKSTLRLHTAFYDRESVVRAAETFAPFATIEVAAAGPEPFVVVDVEPFGAYDEAAVLGELTNHALVHTVEQRSGG